MVIAVIILGAIGLVLVTGLVLLGRVLSLVQQAPGNNPAQFLRERTPSDTKKVVVCLGDSLTHGSVSYNFVHQLAAEHPQFAWVNAGVNGNRAAQIFKRLPQVIVCKPNYVVVLIGANDARDMLPGALRKTTPAAFTKQLTKVISTLQQKTTARIALVTPPPIGEKLDDTYNAQLAKVITIIQNVATAQGVACVDYHATLQKFIQTNGHNTPFVDSSTRFYKNVVQRYIFGRSYNAIGKRAGYVAHCDGLHLNNNAGQQLAAAVWQFVGKK